MNSFFEERFDGISKSRLKLSQNRQGLKRDPYAIETDFCCTHCHNQVSTDPWRSGVQNRNHCPYCLWSRHLDWFEAGDRMSPCKAPMRPVGLTFKRHRKKYEGRTHGELMLVHICTACDDISINRIAADDDAVKLLEVFESSHTLDDLLRIRLEVNGIELVQSKDKDLVYRRLGLMEKVREAKVY